MQTNTVKQNNKVRASLRQDNATPCKNLLSTRHRTNAHR